MRRVITAVVIFCWSFNLFSQDSFEIDRGNITENRIEQMFGRTVGSAPNDFSALQTEIRTFVYGLRSARDDLPRYRELAAQIQRGDYREFDQAMILAMDSGRAWTPFTRPQKLEAMVARISELEQVRDSVNENFAKIILKIIAYTHYGTGNERARHIDLLRLSLYSGFESFDTTSLGSRLSRQLGLQGVTLDSIEFLRSEMQQHSISSDIFGLNINSTIRSIHRWTMSSRRYQNVRVQRQTEYCLQLLQSAGISNERLQYLISVFE